MCGEALSCVVRLSLRLRLSRVVSRKTEAKDFFEEQLTQLYWKKFGTMEAPEAHEEQMSRHPSGNHYVDSGNHNSDSGFENSEWNHHYPDDHGGMHYDRGHNGSGNDEDSDEEDCLSLVVVDEIPPPPPARSVFSTVDDCS